ncbi:MAG TPA: hypothetical protein PKO15_01515 [Fibrobacteria bacterium]|nr:hypothetical protein [Fibrobacteria bacterium]
MKPSLESVLTALSLVAFLWACDSGKPTEPPTTEPTGPTEPTAPPPTGLPVNDSLVWIRPAADADTVWVELAAKDRLTYRFTLSVEGAKLSAVRIGSPTGSDGKSAVGRQIPGKGDSVWIWASEANQTIRIPLEIRDSVGRIGLHGRAEIDGIPMDGQEPDSDGSAAMRIPFDSLVTRTLTANDTDWFLLPEGDSLSYDLRVTDGKGATIDWIAEDGARLQGGSLGDSAGGKVHRSLLRPCLSPSVRVRIVSGSTGKGTYTLVARKADLLPPDRWDPDGSRSESRKATDTLKPDASAQWRTLTRNDLDFPIFWADSGKVYQIEASSRLPLRLELYGPAGSRLAYDGEDALTEGIIRFLCKSTGYHYVEIAMGRMEDTGVYTVRLRSNPVTLDASDPADDRPEGARALVPGRWIDARLPAGDADWWTAEVSKDTSYVLRLEGDGYVDLRTYWAADTTKSPTGWGGIFRNSDSMWFKPKESGKMAISLSGAPGAGVAYRIQIHPYVPASDPETPNGSISLAQPIKVSATDTSRGDLTVHDEDFWKVPVDSGKGYFVLLWGPTRVGLEWYDEAGNKLPSGQLVLAGHFPMPNATKTLTSKYSGFAYLKISKDNSSWVVPASNGPYKFLVTED